MVAIALYIAREREVLNVAKRCSVGKFVPYSGDKDRSDSGHPELLKNENSEMVINGYWLLLVLDNQERFFDTEFSIFVPIG